ncbi:MAG: GIY-YIG nuclease family protein [Phycisphaerales bacterium]|nr:GIY-YIG nuclease family protein [Hyphomonadaceae bacterium]
MPSWVYILRCSDGSYYAGVTSNIERRLDEHFHSEIGYVAKRKPFEYLWSEEFANIDDAIGFEKQVKGWSRAKKEALMRGDWLEIQRLAKLKGRSPGPPSTSSG